MSYAVIWMPPAENQLARIWTAGPDRNEISAAADTIDAALQRDPLNTGEARGGVRRVVFEGPLGVSFKVPTDRPLVFVTAVWRVR